MDDTYEGRREPHAGAHSEGRPARPRARWVIRRLLTAVLALSLSFAGVAALAAPASAFFLTGCRWPSKNLAIDTRDVAATFKDELRSAVAHVSRATDVTLTAADRPSSFSAMTRNFGKTGWHGLYNADCDGGKAKGMTIYMNTTYLSSKTASGYLRLVWLHEICHGLGLGHTYSRSTVMWEGDLIDVYDRGIRDLTADEVAGINYLY